MGSGLYILWDSRILGPYSGVCIWGSVFGVPFWRPELWGPYLGSRFGGPFWGPVLGSRFGVPNSGGSSASRMSYLLRSRSGGPNWGSGSGVPFWGSELASRIGGSVLGVCIWGPYSGVCIWGSVFGVPNPGLYVSRGFLGFPYSGRF